MKSELIKEAVERMSNMRSELNACYQVLDWIADGAIDPRDGMEKVAHILQTGQTVAPVQVSLGRGVADGKVAVFDDTDAASPEELFLRDLNNL